MEKELLLRFQRKGKQYWSVRDRNTLTIPFETLIPAFPGGNENSKQLVEIINYSESVFINWDTVTEETDLNLEYWMADGNRGMLRITNEHTVVRMLLKGNFIEGEIIPLEFAVEWTYQGIKNSQMFSRKKIMEIFQKVITENPENNGKAKKIASIIPYVKNFYINWDGTATINALFYTTLSKEESSIPIEVYHKKVWRKLKKICGVLSKEETAEETAEEELEK